MDYWAKDIYSWGMFSAEVYPRAQLQFKEWLGCREFPVHSTIYRWVNKYRTHGIVHNLNRKDTNRQSHSGRAKASRTPQRCCCLRLCCPQPKQVCACGLWQSTPSDMSRCLGSSGQHLVDGEGSLGSSSGSSRMVPPHLLNESLAWLQQRFPDRLISRRCDPQWSPHSPDLNPPDFYLWVYLKDRVYGNNPRLSLTWRQQSQ